MLSGASWAIFSFPHNRRIWTQASWRLFFCSRVRLPLVPGSDEEDIVISSVLTDENE